MSPPIIFENDGKWYWCDETYAEYGPYATREEALEAQTDYCVNYLGIQWITTSTISVSNQFDERGVK
jgi:hypothetical protein